MSLELGRDLRPRLHLRLPRQYKTDVIVDADGATFDGEHDRLSAEDKTAIEAWLLPIAREAHAKVRFLQRHGYYDPVAFARD